MTLPAMSILSQEGVNYSRLYPLVLSIRFHIDRLERWGPNSRFNNMFGLCLLSSLLDGSYVSVPSPLGKIKSMTKGSGVKHKLSQNIKSLSTQVLLLLNQLLS